MQFCVSTVHVEKASVSMCSDIRSCVVTTKDPNHQKDIFSVPPVDTPVIFDRALCGIPTITDSFCTVVVVGHGKRLL